jgi:hypothetical protein
MPPEVKSRRFPPPWAVDETEACFIVRNANGQALAYVYFEDEPAGARRRSYSRAMKRGASPPTSPSCLPELGARSAADFERIARDDRQSMVKPFRSIARDPPLERNPSSLPPPIQQENHSIDRVFTQPGSKAEVAAFPNDVRSSLNSRHSTNALRCLKSQNRSFRITARAITVSARMAEDDQRHCLSRVSGPLCGFEGLLASAVRVRDPELLTCLARKVDDLMPVHLARAARWQDDVTECDLLQHFERVLHRTCLTSYDRLRCLA